MIKHSTSNLIIVFIIVFLIAYLFSISVISDHESIEQESISIFTLSFNGVQKEYSLEELTSFPSVTGFGGRLKVTGDVVGPYEYTGVSILTLANEFSSIPSNFNMVTIADDGYVFKYTYNNIKGNIKIYDKNGDSQGIGNVDMILAYQENGDPLVHGGPLRIAFVNEEEVVTDAFLWSKYVEEIEFVFDTSDSNPPDISVDKPSNAIYIFDQEIISYSKPFVIGDITFEISVYDENDIANVLFIIGNDIKSKQRSQPYQWIFDENGLGDYSIKIISYDNAGNIGIAQKDFLMFNFF